MVSVAGLVGLFMLWQAQSAPAARPQFKLQAIKVTEMRELSLTEEGEEMADSEERMIRFSQQEPGLVVSLALSGPGVERVTHYGLIELADGKDDIGQPLKLRSRRGDFGDDPIEAFTNLRERHWSPEPERSRDMFVVQVPFKATARTATKISAHGTVKVKVAETVDALIDDVLQKRGKIKNATLDDFDLVLRITSSGAGEGKADEGGAASAPASSEEDEEDVGWTRSGPFGGEGGSISYVLQGDVSVVLDQQFLDADGKPLLAMPAGSSWSDRRRQETFRFDKKPRGPVQLKLVLVKKRTTIDVPFEFKDVPLP